MEDEIRIRAYDIWEYRMHFDIEGDDLDDWLNAEREVHALFSNNSIDHVNAFKMYYIRGGY